MPTQKDFQAALQAHEDGCHGNDPWFAKVCVKCALATVDLHELTLPELRKLARQFGGPADSHKRGEVFGWLNDQKED